MSMGCRALMLEKLNMTLEKRKNGEKILKDITSKNISETGEKIINYVLKYTVKAMIYYVAAELTGGFGSSTSK